MKLVIAVALLLAIACSSSKPHETPTPVVEIAPVTVTPIAPQPPPTPYTGPLTVELVMAARDAVHLFQPWDEAYAQLEGKLGKPTKIDGDKYEWAATRDDDCADFIVEREDGAHYQQPGMLVGTIHSPKTFGKDGAQFGRGDCLELVGLGVAPEDPTTPGPKAVETIKDVVANAVKSRSKWDGHTIVPRRHGGRRCGRTRRGSYHTGCASAVDWPTPDGPDSTTHSPACSSRPMPDRTGIRTPSCRWSVKLFANGTL